MKRWAEGQARGRPQLLGVGYFGSYARGDWGVGSDLDLVVVVGDTSLPAEKRLLDWDSKELPVPADFFVYTRAEWEALGARKDRFARTLEKELKWIYRREGFSGKP